MLLVLVMRSRVVGDATSLGETTRDAHHRDRSGPADTLIGCWLGCVSLVQVISVTHEVRGKSA